MDASIKDWITYDYGEAKDLAKTFLTLISAILVFSITFSDKVINFPASTKRQRTFIVASWVLFVAAVVLCGVSMLFDYAAMTIAVDCGHEECPVWIGLTLDMPKDGYFSLLNIANTIMVIAGSTFGLGLLALVASAIKSISSLPASPPVVLGQGPEPAG